MSVSVGISLCAGMRQYCRYFHSTIQKYMQIPTYTYNTYLYRHTYLYLQYLHIPAKPTYTYVYCYTYIYIQYLQIHIIPTHTAIPTYTYNTYIYMQYLDILTYLHIPVIPTDTYIYLRITVYTYRYMLIHAHLWSYLQNTCRYMLIHAHTCIYPTTRTWNCHISATSYPFETSQRTVLTTVSDRQIWLVCCNFCPFATIWLRIENWARGPSLVHQNSRNNPSISAHSSATCTMRVGERLGQVWASLDDPGWFYCHGKMHHSTKMLEGGTFDAPSSHK